MRFATFASGGGSNFGALLAAVAGGSLDAVSCLLVVDRANTGAADRARAADVPVAVLAPSDFADESAYAVALLDALRQADTDLIVLAGFLKMIPVAVIHAYPNRILNIHPSLLPAHGGKGLYGRRVHQSVLDAGDTTSGATVHLVDADYDTGPVVSQRSVPVLPDDTPDSLAARVLAVEHQLLPHVVGLFAQNRVRVAGRRVTVA
jgi:phosphoribosylglycinamide formyltransferase-1